MAFSGMDTTFLAAGAVAATTVGLSKGGLPIIGMLAVPVLSLAIPAPEAAGLLLPIYVVSDVFGIIAYRRAYDRRNLAILVPAGIAGIAAGWAIFWFLTRGPGIAALAQTLGIHGVDIGADAARRGSERAVTLLVGCIGLAFCLNIWLQRGRTVAARPADIPRGLFWGAIAGFTSFVSHAGAPPYQMYALPQKMEKMVFAGTSTILFAIINAAKLPPYWHLGMLSIDSLEAMLPLFPVAIAATYAGVALTRILPQELFYRLVTGALLLVSVKLCFDGILG